jgi:putative DNA primase/helicase
MIRPIPSQGPASKNATTAKSERSKADDPPFRYVETYHYHNADGVELFAVDRKERIIGERKEKSFIQWRIVDGKRVNNREGVLPVPYRLPRLVERSAETVWIVEGEKDVHSLEALGLLATCNPGGAACPWSRLDPSSLTVFRGREVRIIPDNDDTGRRHAEEVARSVTGHGAVARIVSLPGLSTKGDATDWIEAGGTRERLEALADHAEIWQETTTASNVLAFPGGRGERLSRELLYTLLTEAGNGERIATTGRGRIAWIQEVEAWYGWNGKQWERTPFTAERIARDEIPQQWAEWALELTKAGDADIADKVWKWHRTSRQRSTVLNSLASARGDLVEALDSFDRHPAEINAANGIIDLTTGELLPHDPTRRHTKMIPVAYDPDATCPRWLEALGQIFKGRSHLIRYFQTYAGYSLTGDTRAQTYLVLHGSGSNGKGMIVEVLSRIFDAYAYAMPSESLMATRNPTKENATPSQAKLFGKRLAVASEVPDGARFDDALIKRLTGEDTITARDVFKSLTSFSPTHKLWIACNDLPKFRGSDEAMSRRIRLLPFEAKFKANPSGPDEYQRDDGLKAYLLNHELPGILAWLVTGACRFYANPTALEAPAEVAAASRSYALANDPLGQFLDECCDQGEGLEMSLQALTDAFNKWTKAEDENAKPWSNKRLWAAIQTNRNVKHVEKVKRKTGAILLGVGFRVTQG